MYMNKKILVDFSNFLAIGYIYCFKVCTYYHTHIHEELCVVEHRVQSLLREVATGGREVAVPRLQGGVKGLQVTFNLLYLAHLESRHPEEVNK